MKANNHIRKRMRRVFASVSDLWLAMWGRSHSRLPDQRSNRTKEGKGDVNDFFTMMEKLQGMFDSEDVEVITIDGRSIRGRIDNLRSTQPFSKPAVKIISIDGTIIKVLFSDIKELIDHRKNR